MYYYYNQDFESQKYKKIFEIREFKIFFEKLIVTISSNIGNFRSIRTKKFNFIILKRKIIYIARPRNKYGDAVNHVLD